MRRRAVLSLALMSWICGTASAGPRLWDVYYRSDQAYVNVVVAGYRSDSLFIQSGLGTTAIPQDSIRLILRRSQAHPELGVLGIVGGAVVGATVPVEAKGLAGLFAPVARVGNMLVGGLVGGVLGVAIGSGMGADTEYRIEQMSPEDKRKLLTRLFSKAKKGHHPAFCPTCPEE